MGHPPIEELLPKTDWSIYKLVRMAAQRAAQLASGKKPLIEVEPKTKTATIVLEEIQNAQVVLKDMADRFEPKEPKKEEPPKEEDII